VTQLRMTTPPGPARRAPRARFALVPLLAFVVVAGSGLFAAVPHAGLERALAAQRTLVEERPADATVREDLGSLLVLAGDFAGAEAAFREAVALAPASATAHFQLGGILEKLGHEKKALKEYKTAIELDPDFAWAHYEAGSIYDRRGSDNQAKRSYARALGLDPSLADPEVNPHILENRWATSAMILAYRDYTPETSAPPTFHEPGRIAGLIIERPHEDQLAEEEQEAPDEGGESGGYARVTGGGADHEAGAMTAEEGSEEPEKVLTSRDLDTGSKAGQVVGGAAVGGVPAVGNIRGSKAGADSAAERARAREAARAASRPARTTPGGVSIPQNPMFPPGTPSGTAGGGNFTPAPESTGRIDVRLEEPAGSSS
jgi:hypothetical protein